MNDPLRPPRPFPLHSRGARLSAWVFGPGPAPESPLRTENATEAWLAVPPFGEERKGAVRALVDFFRAPAMANTHALLFDAYGTGDSPGDFEDADLDRWADDTNAALDALREYAQSPRVVLLAVRAGARLALELAARRPDAVQRIVAWEPVPDTAAWLREIQRRSRFRLGPARDALDKNDVDGYLYAPRLCAQLAAPPSVVRPPPDCPVRLLTLAPGGRPGVAAQKTAESWGVAAQAVDLPPFWLESDVVDFAPLIHATLNA